MKKNVLIAGVLTILMSWVVGPMHNLYAEVEQTELQVDGLSCPFCSLGLEKKLKRLEGIEKVQVHMKQGTTELKSKAGQPFNLVQIRQAVKEAGFTLRAVRMKVKGKIVREEGAWALESSGDQSRFLLFDAKHAREEAHPGTSSSAIGDEYVRQLQEAVQTGSQVVVEGRVHEHGELPLGLLIERLELQ